ncbi:MAG: glycosyltransferase, partial [Acidobacteriia bacterium]|nr:glycosyltransferase [Terriglobia bacterium]
VDFDIYGPIEDGSYWQECQNLIGRLPTNIQVQYKGMIPHRQVYTALSRYDLFLFPTLGENFGHVIAEALLAGCPVLISDQTPWLGLEGMGVGWDRPVSEPARFREVLQRCLSMGPEEHAAMRARAARFGAKRANDPAVIEQNRALFRCALEFAAKDRENSALGTSRTPNSNEGF